jgi:hypothetical protein
MGPSESDRGIRPKCRLWVVCHECRPSTTVRNCTRDEGRPFEVGSQVQTSSYRKLPWSKAMVVSVAETPGRDPDKHG